MDRKERIWSEIRQKWVKETPTSKLVDVTEIESVLEGKIRLDYIDMLVEGGFDSVESVLSVGQEGLQEVNGIGPKTAALIFEVIHSGPAGTA